MVGAVRLDVGVVFVQSKIEKSRGGFVTPAGLGVVVPGLGGAGFERHAVERHAPPPASAALRGLRGLGVQGHFKSVGLRAGPVGIATAGKGAWSVVGPAVGFDEAKFSFGGDGDFVCAVCARIYSLKYGIRKFVVEGDRLSADGCHPL